VRPILPYSCFVTANFFLVCIHADFSLHHRAFGLTYLAVINGSFWKPLLPDASPDPETWPDIDIIVPARNEADSLPASPAIPAGAKIIPAPGASFWSMITAPTTRRHRA